MLTSFALKRKANFSLNYRSEVKQSTGLLMKNSFNDFKRIKNSSTLIDLKNLHASVSRCL